MQKTEAYISPAIQRLQKTSTTQIDSLSTQYFFDGLQKRHIWAYGVGHTLNDLTATCWFNYLLYFLKKVLFVESATDAILIGQVVDGIATPLIGFCSDKINTRIGQRKPWYIASIILLAFSTILLFSGYKSQNETKQAFFYISMALVYCLGFAMLQISHMSLVPSLTCSRKRRDQLNNLRNLFTFISNFVVLGFGLVIFSVMTDRVLQYKILADISTVLGVFASLYFIFAINEPKLTRICKQKQRQLKRRLQQSRNINQITIQKVQESEQRHQLDITIESQQSQSLSNSCVAENQSLFVWFKSPKFYLYGICYVSARMYVNMFGTLIPFYINDVLRMVDFNQQKVSFNLALIPMLVYIASVLMSCKLNYFYREIGRKNSLLLGTFLCMICCFSMVFIDESNCQYFYAVALLIGASQSLVLSTGVNLISDVIGAKAKSGAFVFGFYSMIDKIAVGVGIFVVGETEAYSKTSVQITAEDRDFIKWTVILVPGISCLLSAAILSITSVNQYIKSEVQTDQLSKQSTLEKQLVF